jgi:hypothetical protein
MGLKAMGLLVYLNHPPAAFVAKSNAVLSQLPADQYEMKTP